jgi:hypothetical protein
MSKKASKAQRDQLRVGLSDSKTLVIPSSVKTLSQNLFKDLFFVKVVKFAPDSQIRRLKTGTFGLCREIRSICIPASVEFIGADCFFDSTSEDRCPPIGAAPGASCCLTSITFEPGSHLREIQSGAFRGCEGLQAICVPASVAKMTGGSFPKTRYCRITIESENRHFRITGDFLMDFNGRLMVRYCGHASDVLIPAEIEAIGEFCFAYCKGIDRVSIWPGPKLASIGSSAFLKCKALRSMSIPALVTSLGDHCFSECSSLKTVTFAPTSRLDCIPDQTFQGCSALATVTVPASVKTLGARCFSTCAFRDSPLPLDSEVVRIGPMAFSCCLSLQSIDLPPSLEFVGDSCFHTCNSLTGWHFLAPSRLRELLDVPVTLSGIVAVPDSVEVVAFWRAPPPRAGRTLTFGCDSKLTEITAKVDRGAVAGRGFLQVASRSLKVFRARLEFKADLSHSAGEKTCRSARNWFDY